MVSLQFDGGKIFDDYLFFNANLNLTFRYQGSTIFIWT